jgi:hypothetical protein
MGRFAMLSEGHFFQAPFYDGLLCFHDLLSRLISKADASDARPSFNHRGNNPIMLLSELHITRQWESHAIAFLAKQHLDVICVSWKNCFGLFSNA